MLTTGGWCGDMPDMKIIERNGWWYVVGGQGHIFAMYPFPSRSTAEETVAAARVSNDYPMEDVW